MWSGPRTVSTAMMYSWRQRSDTEVVDEPWYARYLLHTGVRHPVADVAIASQPTDVDEIIAGMLAPGDQPIRFLKNMAHHLVGLDLSVLDLTDNFLLVRHPRDALPSLHAALGRVPTLDQTGLDLQVAIYERLSRGGRPPPVVVTRSLLEDPRRVLAELCDALEVGFEEAALSWPAGPKPEDGVWAPHWYTSVHRSTGFGSYRTKSGPIRADLVDLLEQCRPLFDRLATNAL